MENKGEYLGLCNLSACTTGKPANWHNYGNNKHYCEDCAKKLNSDPYNQRDAMRLFGHELCKEVHPEPRDLEDLSKELSGYPYTEYVRNNPEALQHMMMDYPPMTKKEQNQVCVPVRNSEVNPKIQNNEPCPCGSGNKYKKCCKQN